MSISLLNTSCENSSNSSCSVALLQEEIILLSTLAGWKWKYFSPLETEIHGVIFSALHDGSGTRSKMEMKGIVFRNTALQAEST